MLTRLPKVGEFVKVLDVGEWDDGEVFQTVGDTHEIVGVSEEGSNPYFIGDLGGRIYIDEASFDMYELSSFKEIVLDKTETSIYGANDDSTRLTLKFSSYGLNAMKNAMSLREDIKKLIKEKYQ